LRSLIKNNEVLDMNKELKTRSTDREALERKEEEKVEGRVSRVRNEVLSTDLGDCRHGSPSSSWAYLAYRDWTAQFFYPSPAYLGLAVRKLKYRGSSLRRSFVFFRWSNYFTMGS
jgi:hypothetical protein